MQFRLRSLLLLTALVAISTMPAYRYSIYGYEMWMAPHVVVVPDNGTLIMGGKVTTRRWQENPSEPLRNASWTEIVI